MRKLVSIILALTLVCAVAFTAFAEDEIVDGDANVRTWTAWKQDGNEITVNKVKINSDFIVTELSSNWEIKQQDLQTKITDTYWSPATVWTKNASKDFELTFDVFGGTDVQIGFLHCVGNAGGGVTMPCANDGHDLAERCKLFESADGKKWTEVDTDILPAEDALVSGMTGYDNTDIHPYNGDGVAEYSEAYFVISGQVSDDAKYVKYWFVGNGRSHFWDPCVRDAIFTAPSGKVWETETSEESTEESEDEKDSWINVTKNCTYEVIAGTIRNDGYGDASFNKLTDGFWATTGSDGIGALDSATGVIVFDLGEAKEIKKIEVDLWYGAWGISAPAGVYFYVSNDNENFYEFRNVTNEDATALIGSGDFVGYLYTAERNMGEAYRYVKVEYEAGSHVWTSEAAAYVYDGEYTGELEPYEEPSEDLSEEPASEEPISEEPTSEEPTSEEPVSEEPISEEPVSEEPVSKEPASEASASDEATVGKPDNTVLIIIIVAAVIAIGVTVFFVIKKKKQQ